MLKSLSKNGIKALVRILPRRAQEFLQHHLNQTLAPPSSEPCRAATSEENYFQQSFAHLSKANFAAARSVLKKAAIAHPLDVQIAPQLRRIEFLEARSRDPHAQAGTRQLLTEIAEMNDEIRSAPIYVPSAFWESIGNFHLQLLETYGVENFKRTVSHSYQNWLMTSFDDPQVRRILELSSGLNSVGSWFNSIEVPSHVGYHLSLNFNEPFYPLAFAEQREVYRIAVSLLWDYVGQNDTAGVLNQLEESLVGNPILIHQNGKRISSDLAHSVRERNIVLGEVGLSGREGLTVGELGAGQGRLTEVFTKTTNYRYFIFDITPALYVAQWYARQLFPDEKIFEFRHFNQFEEIREELQDCRIAFFTANQIEKLPDRSLDLFINMNSLMEMRTDQISHYLGHIDRLTRLAFLSRQWFRWTNHIDLQTVSKADFQLPAERWRVVIDEKDEIYPDFFNQLWKRF